MWDDSGVAATWEEKGCTMTSKSKSDRKRHAATHHQNEKREVATSANDAVFAQMAHRAEQHFFANRGFSADSIKALSAHGIGLPEELLLMKESQILQIAGLDANGLAEVRTYRRRFRDGA
jgi:hypothetical protein